MKAEELLTKLLNEAFCYDNQGNLYYVWKDDTIIRDCLGPEFQDELKKYKTEDFGRKIDES